MVASDEQVRAVVEILKGASKPLIIVGSAGAYSQSGEALENLIETTRVPLMTEGARAGWSPMLIHTVTDFSTAA